MVKVSKKAKIRNQYNQVSYLTQDTTFESDKKHKNHHTLVSQEAIPFPADEREAAMVTDQKAWITRNINNKRDLQKKYRLGSVSKNFLTGGHKLVLWYQPYSYFRTPIVSGGL